MESLNVFLLIGTGLMFVGLLLGTLSARIGVPSLLVFLVVGMVAGEDGIGGIEFDDFSLAYVVSNIALAIILLDGGLRTRLLLTRARHEAPGIADERVEAPLVITGPPRSGTSIA